MVSIHCSCSCTGNHQVAFPGHWELDTIPGLDTQARLYAKDSTWICELRGPGAITLGRFIVDAVNNELSVEL